MCPPAGIVSQGTHRTMLWQLRYLLEGNSSIFLIRSESSDPPRGYKITGTSIKHSANLCFLGPPHLSGTGYRLQFKPQTHSHDVVRFTIAIADQAPQWLSGTLPGLCFNGLCIILNQPEHGPTNEPCAPLDKDSQVHGPQSVRCSSLLQEL